MKVRLLAITLLVAISAFAQTPVQRGGKADELHRSFIERGKAGPIGVLFIGDSITQGWSSHPEIWNAHFGKYNAANFGIGGDKVEHVLWRIEQGGELDAINPRAVVLLIGTNNSSDSAEFIANGVTKIVNDIHQKLPSANLLLLGIFPRGADPNDPKVAQLRTKIATVNRALAKLDDGARTRYLDIGSKFLSPDGSLSKDIMPDALHLSAAGYEIWANAIQPVVDQMMSGAVVHPEKWPARQPPAKDPAIERRVDALLNELTLEEKVAQVIQPAIAFVTPEDVRKYHFGSILNGGGGWPGDVRKARPKDWLNKADAFWEASMDTSGGKHAIPVIWGADAIHGHNNLIGATLFPHNIGLGATRDAELVRKVGEITAVEMSVTGQDWNFFPNVSVVQDVRWGRSYESYSEDPRVVAKLAAAFVKGLQTNQVLATSKHYIGDGGTVGGKDQGDNIATEEQLRDIHAAGYYSTIDAGVQTIMASYNSWHGVKMHGNRALLTDVLKGRMGFDGIIVGDWNGHAQVPGCTNASCPQSFNAGLDMFMVPEDWKALYENTLAQVKSGEIPQARLDDAVRRILRVKMRSHLFDGPKPSQRPLGGHFEKFGTSEHRAVARRAVRESLVLLKNNGGVLPLRAKSNVLITGDGADSIPKQTGGWTISWQGTENTNADFPGATSVWEGIRREVEHAGGHATLNADGSFAEKPDVAIVVFGENPYAEFQGDRRTLVYNDAAHLAMLRKFRDAGVPVVSVFLSGRPLWVNPFLNASNAFVAAWLPGTEAGGIADVLFGKSDFRGKLSFAWQDVFPFGYGLTYKSKHSVPQLSEQTAAGDIAESGVYFSAGAEVAPWKLTTSEGVTTEAEGQQARAIRFARAGQLTISSDQAVDLTRESNANLAISFDVNMRSAPTSPVRLSVGSASLDVTPILRALPAGQWQTVRVRLRCFETDMSKVTTPFRLSSEGELALAISDVKLIPATEGAAQCPQ